MTDAGDRRAFARLADSFPDNRVINGHPEQVDPIVSGLARYAVQELHRSYYCRLPRQANLVPPAWPTRRATLADVEALTELYATAGLMRRDANWTPVGGLW